MATYLSTTQYRLSIHCLQRDHCCGPGPRWCNGTASVWGECCTRYSRTSTCNFTSHIVLPTECHRCYLLPAIGEGNFCRCISQPWHKARENVFFTEASKNAAANTRMILFGTTWRSLWWVKRCIEVTIWSDESFVGELDCQERIILSTPACLITLMTCCN